MLAGEAAVVLFSGGQDSTTCLAWALSTFARVDTIAFDYGQRHRVELACAEEVLDEVARSFPAWRDKLGARRTLSLPTLREVSESALTRDVAIEMTERGLPSTFVPGRNLLFLTYAALIGERSGARHLVGGMCETDYSGYPDCRDDTLKALQLALNLGTDRRFVIHTPLMWRDKAETWALAAELGGPALVALIRERTHTCYTGAREPLHAWGRGCGDCPACRLRAQGWERFNERGRGAAA